jgi:hypothetical protein
MRFARFVRPNEREVGRNNRRALEFPDAAANGRARSIFFVPSRSDELLLLSAYRSVGNDGTERRSE